MTDRIHSFTVVLDQDIRTDDVEAIVRAIEMIRHVADVRPHVADMNTHTAYVRARSDLAGKLYDALKEQ